MMPAQLRPSEVHANALDQDGKQERSQEHDEQLEGEGDKRGDQSGRAGRLTR